MTTKIIQIKDSSIYNKRSIEMFSRIIKYINICIVIFNIILLIYISTVVISRSLQIGFLDHIHITINSNEFADCKFVSSKNNDMIFDFIDNKTKNQLIDFMKSNNLRILPGNYEANDVYNFYNILSIFKFSKIN